MKRETQLLLAASSVLLLTGASAVACSSTPTVTETPDASSPSSDGGLDTDSGQDAGPPAVTCKPVTGEGTTHDKSIEADETWTAEGSPHIVPYSISVRSGATLTIEPCAVVQIASEKSILVASPPTPNTGTIKAEGTPTEPIRFTGIDGATWGHILVSAGGKLVFRYVTLENGGDDRIPYHASLIVRGNSTTPTTRDALLDHVTIKDSAGFGAVFDRAAGFAPGSTALTITGSGKAFPDDEPFPLQIGENGMGSIPDGTYTGNVTDELLVMPEAVNATAGMQESATLRDLGVPYRIGTGANHSLRVEAGPGGSATTLTIDPGVIMRFAPETDFEISHFTGEDASPATLIAKGTEAKPIVFTSASATPKAGDWGGLWFGLVPNGNNKLDHVRIEYAGHDCSCVLISCNEVNTFSGGIIFTQEPSAGFSITNTTFFEIAGNGITRGWEGGNTSFAATNTFTNVADCHETLPVPPGGDCPQDPKPPCP